ncbi:MAG: monovalent cation/H(+) antiporter subunit G [Anaerolineae bacterium]|nr:monovalent cation/H(+) antiporter subunit G [Anaerolineae bacterium]MDW8172041.1 monovalent cation/H(+) antiporter subunit G [Anaerolineae bacterium]
MSLIEGVGATFIVFGLIFSSLGVVGVVRLPDTYSRLHASGKTATLGIIFLCLGGAVLVPDDALKLAALLLFMMFTSPVVSHAIAASMRRATMHQADHEEPMD